MMSESLALACRWAKRPPRPIKAPISRKEAVQTDENRIDRFLWRGFSVRSGRLFEFEASFSGLGLEGLYGTVNTAPALLAE
jgi:hypothetical protein